MRILILYPTVFPDFVGGIEHRNHELAAALARRGHQATLAAFCDSRPGSQPGLSVVSLGPREGLYNQAGRRSTWQALRYAAVVGRGAGLDLADYDVVETAIVPYTHLLPLALRCRLAGRPLIVTWYEYWGGYWRDYVGRLRAPAYRLVEWLSAQLGDAVTATSRLTAERLAARRARSEVELIPCGIRLAEVQRAAAVAGGRHGTGPPLIYAGRLLRDKRIAVVLRAVAVLAAERPAGVLLRIFGEGPARAELEGLAAELGIIARVDFRGHVADVAEVWQSLGQARVAVQPSEREGFGLFPLEAMAAGLPVVYCESPESAVPELVRDGVEGIGVAPDPVRLAAVLGRLLAGGPEWSRLHAAALRRAAEYDWDTIAAAIERACLRVLR